MANIKLVPSFKTEEEMNDFFKERAGVQIAFNKKVEELKTEAKQLVKDHEENILYSISLPVGTRVRISVDAMNNFYHQIQHLYSEETGLLLNEIQIVLHEYISDLKLDASLRIRFVFVKKEFNNHWASFPLDRLYCDDKDFKFSNQSFGPGLDPKFLDPETYFIAKGYVNEVKSTFSKITKEN